MLGASSTVDEARDAAGRARRPVREAMEASDMKVLGMISGTSHDGIDVAVVDFVLADGVLHGKVGYTASTPVRRGRCGTGWCARCPRRR